jgi:type IV secretion system protein VirB11
MRRKSAWTIPTRSAWSPCAANSARLESTPTPCWPRPDRILLGELRGLEAFAFLRAVNSGHPGSITTVHADSPAGALDQIALLALTSGVDLGWEKVHTYVERVVDVVVQLDRTGGSRRLTEVLFNRRT